MTLLYLYHILFNYLFIGGLEVKLPNSEKWQKLGNLPGAIFINAGELLSTWTNNLYPALVWLFVIYECHCRQNDFASLILIFLAESSRGNSRK